jgi:hypothetical protein
MGKMGWRRIGRASRHEEKELEKGKGRGRKNLDPTSPEILVPPPDVNITKGHAGQQGHTAEH